MGEVGSSQGLLGGDARVREKLQEVSKTDELIQKVLIT